MAGVKNWARAERLFLFIHTMGAFFTLTLGMGAPTLMVGGKMIRRIMLTFAISWPQYAVVIGLFMGPVVLVWSAGLRITLQAVDGIS
eukprot:COSAG01_NODE_69893_length_260_cov_0.633540_1_plen_86_part_11